ncbi:MAG TPA: methylenetetrahydrofolate reductase [Steroidobacteraceae bacterium]|jgi:methylenetetrahydrofolate reductase (NADPH)|nr:methylenetetrahydrofolate reductase [Steroidobacteraceae bacterium]
MGNSLQARLAAGEFAITAEITPPVSADPEALLEKARPLAGLADAVNVTDGASAKPHLDTLTAAGMLLRAGIEPVLQVTCRDRNRIALQSLLIGAAAQGIHNVLALTGDDPRAGDQPDTKPVFDLNSNALLSTARAMRERHELPTGRSIGGQLDFFLGCADMPSDPPADWQPTALTKKIEAGAQFAQTQFCMDAAIVARYLARLEQAGLLARIRILVGIAPLASARSARWIRDKLPGSIVPESIIERLDAAADAREEGQRICVELMHALHKIPGIAGVHIMAPLNDAAIPVVIRAFRG